jgi:DNA-binding beta-propeller fold protein YncE
LRGVVSRVIDMPGLVPFANGVAVSLDGSTLLVADSGARGSHAIHAFRVADGSRLRVIGREGDGPLQFIHPYQLWIAPDGHVFVADSANDRVQVLTPTLDFHCFVGVGHLVGPCGVRTDDDIIVVSEWEAHRISVFNRYDGALLRHFGSLGSGDGQLRFPYGLCFMSGHRHVAIAEFGNHRVSVFSVEGEFIRHVGVGQLRSPTGVAGSAFDELVVADYGNKRVVVFSASGELLKTMECERVTGVTINGGTIFAHGNKKCAVFM